MLVALVGAVGAPSAVAGGSWLELADGDDVLVPGEVATMSGTFGSGQQAGVSAGPWEAWLRSDYERGSALSLGPVAISEGPDWGWRATVTFTVPDAPAGGYWVTVLNDEGEGVGDLIGGFVHVAPSLEAWRITVLRQRIERQQRATRKDVASMRDRLADVRSELAAATAARDELVDRVGDLERAVDDAREAGRARPPAWASWLVPAAASVVLTLLLGLAAVRRRGTPASSTALPEVGAGSLP